VLEIIIPNEDTQMLDAVWNFIIFSIGQVTFTILFVDTRKAYASFLEGLVTAQPETTENLKRFLPIFKQELMETKAEYAILLGEGVQGLGNTLALSYHRDEDEAIYEFKRVAEALERGDISVLVDRKTSKPLLRLEEGTKLLVSNTSTAGTEAISLN